MRYKKVKHELPVVLDEININIDKLEETFEKNEELLCLIDREAALKRNKNHRIIREDSNDGVHLYQVAKYGAKNVRVEFCENVLPENNPIFYWGNESLVSLEYIDSAILEHPAFPENNILLSGEFDFTDEEIFELCLQFDFEKNIGPTLDTLINLANVPKEERIKNEDFYFPLIKKHRLLRKNKKKYKKEKKT